MPEPATSSSSTTKPTTAAATATTTPLWEWDGPQLDAWMMTTLHDARLRVNTDGGTKTDTPTKLTTHEQPHDTSALLQEWYRHVLTSVQAIQLVPRTNDDNTTEERPTKRRRIRHRLQDPYHVWWISKFTQQPILTKDEEPDEPDPLPATMGGRLTQLSPGAWFNALVGKPVAQKAQPSWSRLETALVQAQQQHPNQQQQPSILFSVPSAWKPLTTTTTKDRVLDYALYIWQVAVTVHRMVQATVQKDIWRTTPLRIQQRLASDLAQAEFTSIRKRVYETVILGKGLHTNEADDDEANNLPVAPYAVHDVDKYKKCPHCGNMDQSTFALDRRNGDIICQNCGVVVSQSLMHEGSAYRKFEGEVDRNHHGDAPNALYSNAHNLGTSLSGIAPTAGAGIRGWGGGKGGGGSNLETILRNTHAYTELNVSQYGKQDRRTRVGYKDRQKKEAFVQMTHAGDALNLHEAVVQRAKELFAGFRDDRELVQQFKGVLAACLCEAFEQLAAEGKQGFLVKGVGAQAKETNLKLLAEEEEEEEQPLTGRAARRNELHHAKLAGKGGLLLDFDNKNAADEEEGAARKEAAAAQDAAKPAATWDLEDCRSWLLEASRRIAQQWVEERQAAPPAKKQNWPNGSLEELEGSLVEHSIVLCEHLEKELQSRNSSSAAQQSKNGRRVVTPRVTDMSKLGIKWQHAHERGSGGKGGVGNNVQTHKTTQNQRTAGQILLLKTTKKLSSILKDPLAGESIHKELRAVIGKQETQKRKKLLEEASRQRFQQMQRKPWLQARAQIES